MICGHGATSSSVSRGVAVRGPQLFGDEGHEGMQQLEDLVARPGGGGAGFGLRALRRCRLKIGLVISIYQSQKMS